MNADAILEVYGVITIKVKADKEKILNGETELFDEFDMVMERIKRTLKSISPLFEFDIEDE